MNRREFLMAGGAAVLTAGCATDNAGRVLRSHNSLNSRPRFHVFSKMFQPPVTKSPEELCDLMAGAGYDGIQWTVRKGGHVTPENVNTELPRLGDKKFQTRLVG